MSLTFEVPKDLYKIVKEIPAEDFAPGLWAGSEGLEFVITHIDLEKRQITLELK